MREAQGGWREGIGNTEHQNTTSTPTSALTFQRQLPHVTQKLWILYGKQETQMKNRLRLTYTVSEIRESIYFGQPGTDGTGSERRA